MSMNLFFLAFTQDTLDAMSEDHELIDQAVEEESALLSTDIETAWDALRSILDGTGIEAEENIDDALFNGCAIISSDEVKGISKQLVNWSRESILTGLHNIDDDSDLYHIKVFKNDGNYLVEQFEKMAVFYREASEKGLGAIIYAA